MALSIPWNEMKLKKKDKTQQTQNKKV